MSSKDDPVSEIQQIQQMKQQVQKKLLQGLLVALNSDTSYRADVVSAYVSAYCMLANDLSPTVPVPLSNR
jgi:hypothetical protein